MKSILILCSALAVAHAGVGTLSPQEEQQALDLFQRACNGGGNTGGYGGGSGGGGGDGGAIDLGGFTVFCKRSRDNLEETLNHQVNVPAGASGPGQVVFVQPPPVRYQHNIQLTGSSGQGQQSKIYVLPQRATHQISTNYNPGATSAVKPVVYFLKDGGNNGNNGNNGNTNTGGNNGQYGAPAPAAPAPQAPAQEGYQYSAPVTTFSNGYN